MIWCYTVLYILYPMDPVFRTKFASKCLNRENTVQHMMTPFDILWAKMRRSAASDAGGLKKNIVC
jgi:hypothetical protein